MFLSAEWTTVALYAALTLCLVLGVLLFVSRRRLRHWMRRYRFREGLNEMLQVSEKEEGRR